MKKIIYHGSQYIIEKPEFGKGAAQNDYGRVFYCTESIELAKEWACAKDTNGYANQYELDATGLKILNLNASEYSILNWLAILTKNRTYWQNASIAEEAKKYLQQHFLIDISAYDIIIGYRAEDSYFSFAQDFVANTISLKKLSEAMYLGKLGEQIVLKSEAAFKNIRFLGAEEAMKEEYFVKFLVTGIAEQFGKGNPRYVSGMTGCELVREVLEKSGSPLCGVEDEMYLDKSPEYWVGWALCYYQWFTGHSFEKIHGAIPVNKILLMYPTLHEADIAKFVSVMDEKMKEAYPDTNLKRIRMMAGLSQSELAQLSGVSLRQIQLFEQRQRDINKTQAVNLVRLAGALGCRMEALIER